MSHQMSVIAKPTHNCNLRCSYCYVEEDAEKGRMSQEILDLSLRKVSDIAEESHWIWHGGEPLLMSIDFFKQIKDMQDYYKKKGKRFSNGIQTNGTLITENLLDFIERTRDFYLGVSLDGPKHLNDRTRKFRNGKGSFFRIMEGLREIKKRDIGRGGGGVICVVNAQNIGYPEELYNFFKSEQINVKFNPLIKSGRAKTKLNELEITPRQYGKFLTKLWHVYNKDVQKDGEVTIDLDPFMDIIGNIGTNKPIGCNYSFSCRDSFISIGPQGDIYPCGRFDGIPTFWMGNVKIHTIEEVLNSQINQKLRERNLESVVRCKICDFGQICNSGCMHNAYCEGDVFGKDPYCMSYFTLFKELKNVFNHEKQEAKRRLKKNGTRK